MAKICTVGTLKGGTGKTTFTFNMAGVLAEKHKVLLIDNDPQGNLTTDVGVDVAVQQRKSIREVFENRKTKPEEVIIKEPVKGLPGLDIIPGHIKLIDTEVRLANRSGREQILANWFEDNWATLSKYDYIFLDTNPSMGLLNKNAFYISDKIILVSDVSFNSIQGVDLFIYLWSEARADLRKDENIAALVINNFDKRLNLSAEMREYCKDRDDIMEILIDHPIPSTVKMKETEIEHKPINMLHPNCAAHKALVTVIEELKNREVL